MEQMLDSDRYSATVLRHFETPRYGRSLPEATHRGEAASPARGSRARLYLQVAEGVVTDGGFEVLGCPHTIAAADLVCEDLRGRLLKELERYEAGFLEQRLPLPADKLDIRILLEDAVRNAVRREEN